MRRHGDDLRDRLPRTGLRRLSGPVHQGGHRLRPRLQFAVHRVPRSRRVRHLERMPALIRLDTGRPRLPGERPAVGRTSHGGEEKAPHGSRRSAAQDSPYGSARGFAKYLVTAALNSPSSVSMVVWCSAPAPKTAPTLPASTNSARWLNM